MLHKSVNDNIMFHFYLSCQEAQSQVKCCLILLYSKTTVIVLAKGVSTATALFYEHTFLFH